MPIDTNALAAAFGSSVGHILAGLAAAAVIVIGHHLYLKAAR